MSEAYFDQMARYNRWANQRIYADAATLSDATRKQALGLFFDSVHGTLNHLLVTDYIWMQRFTGQGPVPKALNQILHTDFFALHAAREHEDQRILDFISGTSDFERELVYQNSSGKMFRQALGTALLHWFNHQTHHRGQVHAGLTIAGMREPTSLDLIALQRSIEA